MSTKLLYSGRVLTSSGTDSDHIDLNLEGDEPLSDLELKAAIETQTKDGSRREKQRRILLDRAVETALCFGLPIVSHVRAEIENFSFTDEDIYESSKRLTLWMRDDEV